MKKQHTKKTKPTTPAATEKHFWMLERFDHEHRHIYVQSIVKAKSQKDAKRIFDSCHLLAESSGSVYCHDVDIMSVNVSDLMELQFECGVSDYDACIFVVLNRTSEHYSMEFAADPDRNTARTKALKSAAKTQGLADMSDLSIELVLTLAEINSIFLKMEN